jgi:chloramphenicol 3-O-phosphotransferase
MPTDPRPADSPAHPGGARDFRPRVVLIHGPPASGKLTIARELASVTGLRLFHNHLVVDLLLSLFPFGSPEFVLHRERIWLELMGDAVACGTSLIFTFNPERTVRPDFPAALQRRVSEAGGRLSPVEVACPEDAIEGRIESESRRRFHKLASLEQYRALRAQGAFDFPPIASELRVDSSRSSPREAALLIAAGLSLGGA